MMHIADGLVFEFSPSPLYSDYANLHTHAFSENDFTKPEKSPHMAVQPHLVRNVESKLKETGNFALRSPVKA